jgi:hypothetical protein
MPGKPELQPRADILQAGWSAIWLFDPMKSPLA